MTYPKEAQQLLNGCWIDEVAGSTWLMSWVWTRIRFEGVTEAGVQLPSTDHHLNTRHLNTGQGTSKSLSFNWVCYSDVPYSDHHSISKTIYFLLAILETNLLPPSINPPYLVLETSLIPVLLVIKFILGSITSSLHWIILVLFCVLFVQWSILPSVHFALRLVA